MGKGSRPRPLSVPKAEFDNNWDIIFGKKDKHQELLDKWAPILDGDANTDKLQTALILESEQKSLTADTLISNLLITLINETNCKETRNEVILAMNKILTERHNTGMGFNVKCNESNNPPEIVDQGKLVAEVLWDNGLEGFVDKWEIEPATVEGVSGYYIKKNGENFKGE